MSSYTIRQFDPDDVDGFLALYDEVLKDWRVSREWFTWKYEDNPYVEHVPMFVAERDGTLVGARPFFALPMVVGGGRCLALQPCDTMVHPDHRRNGLFTRMTERSIDRYQSGEPAFFFNFPNELSKPGYLGLGWVEVSDLVRSYRFKDPGGVISARHDNAGVQVAGTVSTPLVAGFNKLRRATTAVPSGVEVTRSREVPASEFAAIYREAVPETIHAHRSEAFYRWRVGNPTWDYTAYVADDGDDQVGLLVGDPVGLETDVAVRRIIDTVPVDPSGRTDQLVALLDQVIDDDPEADLLVAPSATIPSSVLRQFGFFSGGSPPLSFVSQSRTQVVRALGEWELHGRDLHDADNWSISFLEHDTC